MAWSLWFRVWGVGLRIYNLFVICNLSFIICNPMELSQRISRIIGQLKGIQKMVETKRECGDVLQQVSAVKKAIDGLSKEIVVSNICEFLPHKDVERVSRMIERAINL